jgi:hypothetical protein
MSKSVKSDTRYPRDSKSGHRAKSDTVARKAARKAKRAGQGR